MLKDLDRLWRRKRRLQRVVMVLGLTVVAALLVVGVRTCSSQFQEPYNKDYHPVDVERKKEMGPGR
jgi:hypothetical protein